MFLLVDFGFSVVKLLLIRDDFSLDFKVFPHSAIGASFLRSCSVEDVVDRSIKLFGVDVDEFYISSNCPRITTTEYASAKVTTTSTALRSLNLPIVDVGCFYSYVLGGESSIENVSPQNVAKWVPFKVSVSSVSNYMANKRLFPGTIPATTRDLAFENALTREKIITALPSDSTKYTDLNTIYLTGVVFSEAPQPRHIFLMLSDAIPIIGTTNFFVDTWQVLPLLGTLKHFRSDIWDKVYEQLKKFGLSFLGTAVCSGGEPVTATINSGLATQQSLSMGANEVSFIPLGGVSQNTSVSVKSPSGKFSEEITFGTGDANLFIDTRPHPITLSSVYLARCSELKRWEHALGESL